MAKILVIDDDKLHIDLIVDSLRTLNVEIFTASRAHQGIQIAKQEIPNIIFMDIALPEIDGVTAIHMLREEILLQNVAIIAITATRTSELMYRLEEAGADACLTKPFQLNVLRDYVTEFLDR